MVIIVFKKHKNVGKIQPLICIYTKMTKNQILPRKSFPEVHEISLFINNLPLV